MNSKNIIKNVIDFAEKSGYPLEKSVGLLYARGGYGKFNPSAGHHIVDPILRDECPRPPITFSLAERCLRETDSSKIGISNRHLSFFEMMEFTQVGNPDMLNFEKNTQEIYELITNVLGLKKDKLLVTYLEDCKIDDVHITSQETRKIANVWKNLLGEAQVIPTKGRRNLFIARIPNCAGGPGFEIYYKMVDGRYVEIASQLNYKYIFNGQNNISLTKNEVIAAAFGLERILMALEEKEKIHNISLIKPLKDIVDCGKEKELYDENAAIIADAIRAISFIVYDSNDKELSPSQKKIFKNLIKELRTEINYLGVGDHNIYEKVVQANINLYAERYPFLLNKKDKILETINS
ncbi:MAG: alanine--tRNA ligase-related protein [Candidatus Woesearchaeota archaeon]|nr:alanine--tRNA ligase-related protein [Candidatus Woesearchaeota archaeon]